MKKFMLLAAVMLASLSLTAWGDDPTVSAGKQVKLDYTLTVNNEQIETSVGKEPLVYVVGDNTIIPGLESQLTGMHVGEEKSVVVAAKDAYGEVDPKALKEFPKSSLPKDQEPKVGMVLQATAPDGEDFPAVIKEIKDDKIVLDFNHPLAGKELKFKVKILSISDAPAVTNKPVEEATTPAAPVAPEATVTPAK